MDGFALSPEAGLLVACALRELSPASQRRIAESARGPIDWNAFFELARRHSLVPLVQHHFDSFDGLPIPRNVSVALWSLSEQTGRANVAMASELLRMIRELDAQCIPSLPYKGPVLAEMAFGDLALRPFGDLDLLVRHSDMQRAIEVLMANGYEPEYVLEDSVRESVLRSAAHYHLAFRNRGGVMLELHWKTDLHFPVEGDDAWWERLDTATLQGRSVRAFTPSELLLVLCLHGSKHHWSSMHWLVDVAELVRQDSRIDWDWIVQRARTMRCVRRVALGLDLAHRLLDTPLPPLVVRMIESEPQVRGLSDRIESMLLRPEGDAVSVRQRLQLDLAMCDGPMQRLRHISDVIFEPSLWEWSQLSLPRPFGFLRYPWRLMRLARKHMIPSRSVPGRDRA